MRRLATIACLTAPLAAAAPAPAAQERPPLAARLMSCTTGPTPASRTATFTARMPAAAGTQRMWMRFDLLQRTPGQAEYEVVRLPAWGVWQRSQPGRTAFIYTKTVQRLRAPGAYRARVRFRWYDANGRLQRRAQRTTRTCREPDPRPDLTAGALTAAPGLGADTATYLLDMRNSGRGAAQPFDVVLAVAGMPQPALRVPGLAPGEDQLLSIPGPRCAPGSTVRFVLDAGGVVAESDEADDVVDRPCPVPG
jgi:CARDB protein